MTRATAAGWDERGSQSSGGQTAATIDSDSSLDGDGRGPDQLAPGYDVRAGTKLRAAWVRATFTRTKWAA